MIGETAVNMGDAVGIKVNGETPVPTNEVVEPTKEVAPPTPPPVEIKNIMVTFTMEIPEDIKNHLAQAAERTKLPIDAIAKDLMLDGLKMHYFKGCPQCLGKKFEEAKKKAVVMAHQRDQKAQRVERNRRKRDRAKLARRKNRE